MCVFDQHCSAFFLTVTLWSRVDAWAKAECMPDKNVGPGTTLSSQFHVFRHVKKNHQTKAANPGPCCRKNATLRIASHQPPSFGN
jgi:hypothetical protein